MPGDDVFYYLGGLGIIEAVCRYIAPDGFYLAARKSFGGKPVFVEKFHRRAVVAVFNGCGICPRAGAEDKHKAGGGSDDTGEGTFFHLCRFCGVGRGVCDKEVILRQEVVHDVSILHYDIFLSETLSGVICRLRSPRQRAFFADPVAGA